MADSYIIRCRACGTGNRVPAEKIATGAAPICGRCRARLLDQKQPITVTDDTFSSDVEGFPLPVLVDAWAPWCAPCRMIAPVVEELAKEMAGRIRVAKLNVDDNPATASRFNLRSIPTLLVIKGGREVDRIVGLQPKAEIARRLLRAVA